jgi:hypothetical protein
MILTEHTGKIAPHRSDGKGSRTRIDMKQRLFFNRINIFGNQQAVNQAVKNASLVFSYSAETAFGGDYLTLMCAEMALHTAFRQFFIEHRFLDHLTSLTAP